MDMRSTLPTRLSLLPSYKRESFSVSRLRLFCHLCRGPRSLTRFVFFCFMRAGALCASVIGDWSGRKGALRIAVAIVTIGCILQLIGKKDQRHPDVCFSSRD